MKRRSLLLGIGLSFCRAIALIMSGLHYSIIKISIIKTPVWINGSNEGAYEKLLRTWYARIVRRFISVSVRSLLRARVLKLVNLDIEFPKDSGCVIAACHTPWKRLLVEYCIDKKNMLIIANANLAKRNKGIEIRPFGVRALRKIIDHLHKKGHVIIAIDCFNKLKNCPVDFLGSKMNASTLPVRLSELAKVPLIMTIPVFKNDAINFITVSQIKDSFNSLNSANTIQQLIVRLDNEIKKDPSIWPEFVK
ncbi:MAG: hypothetical protein QM737_00605 [Ferruginibacter sp.]